MKNYFYISLIAFLLTSIPVAAQKTYTLKKGYTVAFSKQSYDRMMDAVSTQDDAYFEKLRQNYEIMVLPKDIEVYLVDSSWGMIVVRIKGDDIKLWTVREALN